MVMGDSYNQDKFLDVTAVATPNGGCNSMEGVDASAAINRITEKWSGMTATTKTNSWM